MRPTMAIVFVSLSLLCAALRDLTQPETDWFVVDSRSRDPDLGSRRAGDVHRYGSCPAATSTFRWTEWLSNQASPSAAGWRSSRWATKP